MSSVVRILQNEDLHVQLEKVEKLLPDCHSVYGWLKLRTVHGLHTGKTCTGYISADPDSPFFLFIRNITDSTVTSILVDWDLKRMSDDTALLLLRSIPEFDWHQPLFFPGGFPLILDKITKWQETCSFTNSSFRKQLLFTGVSLLLDEEKFRTIPSPEIPCGFQTAPLQKRHTEKVYAAWGHEISDSKKNLEAYIERYPTLGAFRLGQEDGDPFSTEKLVSWVVTRANGEMGFTYTIPEYRGKKLASVLVHRLTEERLRLGSFPRVTVQIDNAVSIHFHVKIGFEKSGHLRWELHNMSHDVVW